MAKKQKHSSDYRKSLLVICIFSLKDFLVLTTQIFKTLTEIQELLFLPEIKRTTKTLRFYNTTFTRYSWSIHTLSIKRHFENNLKVLTAKICFGVYYHYLITHDREHYRVVSGYSRNFEREKVLFTRMKNNINQTSSHHPNDIIFNISIRHQAKLKLTTSLLLKEKNPIYTTYIK